MENDVEQKHIMFSYSWEHKNDVNHIYSLVDNEFKERISFSKKIELIEETTEDICESAFKLIEGFNKQEVVIIPKKAKKKGFFEKLFHLFR